MIPIPSSHQATPQMRRRAKEHKERLTVGQYLLKRLEKMGVPHVFANNFTSPHRFSELIQEQPHMLLVETPSNLFMAESYAKTKGIGAAFMCAHSAKAAIHTFDMAFQDNSPLIIIIGTKNLPDTPTSGFSLKHHADELEHSLDKILKKVFYSYSLLDDAHVAAKKIDRTLDSALHYQKPVCIELPEKMVDTFMPPHETRKTHFPPSDPEAFRDAIRHIKTILKMAHKPFICIGT